MIRINLLPVKAAQKKEMLKSQLIVTVLALIVTVGLCAAAMVYVNGEIDKRQAQIDAKRAEIARLAKVIREVKDFEKRQKDLRAKLDVLDRLQASRIGPLYLLDELYRAMPDKLWLTSFKENNGRAQITGVGSNEETVALFMKNLERSDLYAGVELKVTRQAVQDNIKLQQFDLTSATKSGKPGRNGK
ncbi:MAG: PilN domain-containing protein [Desulfuromonadales bacterium]